LLSDHKPPTLFIPVTLTPNEAAIADCDHSTFTSTVAAKA
jgi:hypothetical protein